MTATYHYTEPGEPYTLCGRRLNVWKMFWSYDPVRVTCKRCLSALKKGRRMGEE